MTETTIARGTSFVHPTKRRLVGGGLGALAVTAVAVFGIVGSALAAGSQGSFTEGHVDGFHVALNDDQDQLVLGSNNESGVDPSVSPYTHPFDYFYGSEVDASAGTPLYDFTVDNESSPGVWTIPADQTGYADLWLGFAGSGEEDPDAANSDVFGFDQLSSYVGDTVTLTLESVETSGTGTVDIDFSASPEVVVDTNPGGGAVASYTFELEADDEAFHVHPAWEFTGEQGDTFLLTFVASTTAENGTIADSDPVAYQITLE